MFSTADIFATGRCRYPSKFCPNARAQKRNGELHRFCEEHRARANDNQKRWSSARQRQWDAMEALAMSAAQGSQIDPRAVRQNSVGWRFPPGSAVPYNGYPLEPQPVMFSHDAQLSTATMSSRVVTRTPSQSDQFLTHLLFRNQSSSDSDEHSVMATSTGHSRT